jgi:hypothetical protein
MLDPSILPGAYLNLVRQSIFSQSQSSISLGGDHLRNLLVQDERKKLCLPQHAAQK